MLEFYSNDFNQSTVLRIDVESRDRHIQNGYFTRIPMRRKLHFLALIGSFTTQHLSAASQLPKCTLKNHRVHLTHSRDEIFPNLNLMTASSKHPIVIHYDANSTDSYASKISQYADTSWDVLVDQLGFLPPNPDGNSGGGPELDIYLDSTLPTGVGGYTGFRGFYDATLRSDAVGYVVLSTILKPAFIRGVVAHEFFHTSQIAYDWWESLSFMEGTAVWASEKVFNDENFYWKYFPFFNQRPYLSMDNGSIADPFPYGTGLFAQFLDQKYGFSDGSIIRRIWENSTQETMTNEPDFYDAIGIVVGDFSKAFREFGIWRTLVGQFSRPGFLAESETWERNIEPFFEVSIGENTTEISGQTSFGLNEFSQGIIHLENRTRSSNRFEIVISIPRSSSFITDDKFFAQKFDLIPQSVNSFDGVEFNNSSPANISVELAPTISDVFVVISRTNNSFDPETSEKTSVPFNYLINRLN